MIGNVRRYLSVLVLLAPLARAAQTYTITEIRSATPNPAAYGSNVTMSALVDTGGLAPTGTVTFNDGSNAIGTITVQSKTTTNLVKYSEAIAGGDWGNGGTGTTAVANAAANPFDGTQTATQISFPVSSYTIWLEGINVGSALGSRTFTFSTWLKASSAQTILLVIQEAGGAYAYNQVSVPVSTNWQRYSVTETFPAGETITSFNVRYQLNNNPTVTSIYAWGAQAEEASSSGPYVRTSGNSATGQGATATLTTPSLSAGTHSITAAYTGNLLATVSAPTILLVTSNSAAAPVISGLSPAAGPVGTALTVAGWDFGSTQGSSSITLNGTAMTPLIWSDRAVVFYVPSGAVTGPVKVTVSGKASNSATFTLQTVACH